MSLPIPTLLLKPEGSRDRNGPVSPTLTGAVRVVDGQHGPAWQVAEATTNLFENPHGLNSGAYWGRSGGTLTSDPSVTDEGIPSLRVDATSGGYLLRTSAAGTYAPGEPFTCSISALAAEAGQTFSLEVRALDATSVVQYYPVATANLKTDEFTRISVTIPSAPTGTTRYQVLVLWPNDPGKTYWFARPQMEKKPYATPYCDGSLGPGHTWSGTAHASSSTRDRALLYTDPTSVDIHQGSVAIRYRIPEGAEQHYIVSIGEIGSGTSQNLNLLKYAGTSTYRLRHKGTFPITNYPDQPFDVSSTAYMEWTPDALGMQINTSPLQAASRSDYTLDGGTWSGVGLAPLFSGNTSTTYDYQNNGIVESVLVFDRPLTDAERDALFSVPEPWDWSMFEPLTVTTPPAPVPATPAVQGFATAVIHQSPIDLITINGEPVAVDSWTTRHGVDQPIGTVSLTIPVRGDVSHITRNAPLEVQAGYRDGATGRVFLGRIADVVQRAGPDGYTIRVQAEDEMTRLRYRLEEELVYRGKTQLRDLFTSLATRRGIAMIEASRVLTPNGATDIALGGVPEIDGGDVVLRARTSPLTYLAAKARLFGYRVFGKPSGPAELQRVAGTPSGTPVATFAEGVDIFEVENSRSVRDIINYWTVYGARYSDADGVPIELIAQPVSVPYLPELDPPGYAPGDESDNDLVTQQLVDAVRQTREIDHGAPTETVTWTTWGRPEIEPGDVIAIVAPGAGLDTSALRWVMSVSHTRSSRGFTTTLTAWSGGGTPLPGGITEEVLTIGTGPYRMGDEYLPHYVIDSGSGNEQAVVPFTVPKTYTSLALLGRQHGTNSYLLDGVNTEASVSKLEVWQAGERVGSATLPMSPENLSKAYDYTNDAYWTSFRMPIPGSLEPGAAELRIIAGRDNRISDVFALDDFEVKNLELEARGTWTPILPGVR